MTTDLITLSLEITALGMGLVFGAIILLWVMMIVLTAATAEKEKPAEDESDADAGIATQAGFKAQAAAIAVALALAEQGQSTARPLSAPPTALVSAWQLGMRTSQRTQKGSIGRR
jgi:Na+-transporting methylmalonyl-CoA/oxaloacetate decarboxylase gamma subunit